VAGRVGAFAVLYDVEEHFDIEHIDRVLRWWEKGPLRAIVRVAEERWRSEFPLPDVDAGDLW
jgi:hypothetical protein